MAKPQGAIKGIKPGFSHTNMCPVNASEVMGAMRQAGESGLLSSQHKHTGLGPYPSQQQEGARGF